MNNSILKRLNDANIQSVGLSGTDANLLTAEAKDFERYGYVGHVTEVNALLLQQLIDLGIVPVIAPIALGQEDRKSTRLNSSHVAISYAVFCLKKKIKRTI